MNLPRFCPDPDLESITPEILGVHRYEVHLSGPGECFIIHSDGVKTELGQPPKHTLEAILKASIPMSVLTFTAAGSVINGKNLWLVEPETTARMDPAMEDMEPIEARPFHYLLAMHTPSNPSPDPQNQNLAHALLQTLCFGSSPANERTILEGYRARGEERRQIPMLQIPTPDASDVVKEVYRVLNLNEATDSLLLVERGNLPSQLRELVTGYLEDAIIQPGEKQGFMDFVERNVPDKKLNQRLVVALTNVLLDVTKDKYAREATSRLERFAKLLEKVAEDRRITLGEVGDMEYELGKIEEKDPIKGVYGLLTYLWAHGVESDRNHIPERLRKMAESEIIQVHQLQHDDPDNNKTRLDVIKTYCRLATDPTLNSDERIWLYKAVQAHKMKVDADLDDASKPAIEYFKIKRGEMPTSERLAALRQVAESQGRPDLAVAADAWKRKNEQTLLDVCEKDIDLYVRVMGNLHGFNQYHSHGREMTDDKICEILELKQRFKDAGAEENLFYSLVFSPLQDPSRQYINQRMDSLEKKIRSNEPYQPNEGFIKTLNEPCSSRFSRGSVKLDLQPAFCCMPGREVEEEAYKIITLFTAVTDLPIPDSFLAEDWSGEKVLSASALNECLRSGDSFKIGDVFSIDATGMVHVTYTGKDSYLGHRIGIAAETIRRELAGEPRIRATVYFGSLDGIPSSPFSV